MAITLSERMSEAAYREFALSDEAKQMELVRGQLRDKPGMCAAHGDVATLLTVLLANQLDRGQYKVRLNHARTRVSASTYYIPDVVIIPTALETAARERPGSLDAYGDPLPLVVEVWSPSTGTYDMYEKLPDYQRRGDLEIWYIHPLERTLTAWRRQPDGGYVETVYRGGMVCLESLPGVVIDLDALLNP